MATTSSSSETPSLSSLSSKARTTGLVSKSPTNVADAIFGFGDYHQHHLPRVPEQPTTSTTTAAAGSVATKTTTTTTTTKQPLRSLQPPESTSEPTSEPTQPEPPTPIPPNRNTVRLPWPSGIPGDATRKAFELERKHYPRFKNAVRSLPSVFQPANHPSTMLLVRKPYGAGAGAAARLFGGLGGQPHGGYKRSARVSSRATLEVAVILKPKHPVLLLGAGTHERTLTVRHRPRPGAPLERTELARDDRSSLGTFRWEGGAVSLDALLEEALMVRAQYAVSVMATARALAQQKPPPPPLPNPASPTSKAAGPSSAPAPATTTTPRPAAGKRWFAVWVTGVLVVVVAAAVGFGAALHLLERYHHQQQHEQPRGAFHGAGFPTSDSSSVVWDPAHRRAFGRWILAGGTTTHDDGDGNTRIGEL